MPPRSCSSAPRAGPGSPPDGSPRWSRTLRQIFSSAVRPVSDREPAAPQLNLLGPRSPGPARLSARGGWRAQSWLFPANVKAAVRERGGVSAGSASHSTQSGCLGPVLGGGKFCLLKV